MDDTTGIDSLLLVPDNNGSIEFNNWFDSLRSIVEKLTNSNNKDGLDPQILDILFDGIWITDKEDIIVYVNNSMLNMAGDSKDKIIGTKVLKSYTNGTFQHFIPFYFKAKDLGKPVRYEQAFIRTPAGRITQQTGWMIPRYFQNNFSGIICSVSNVTDAKLLAYSEAKFQALCNSSPNCIFLIDLKGNILYFNNNYSDLFTKNIIGTNILNLFSQPCRKEFENCFRRVKRTQALDRYFWEYPVNDGGKEYFEARVTPIVQAGKVIAIVVNSTNITKQKLLEKELKKQRSNLEETNITLKVLLKRIEKERLLFQENLSTNILCNIEPYINKLKQSSMDKIQKSTLDILDQNIKDMASPLVYSVMTMNLRLTPAEIQISNFIRQGYSSKEIANFLNISPATIDKHRKNIRKKLGITNKKQNLQSVLASLSS
jgi:PAS domain S-box-containing protein